MKTLILFLFLTIPGYLFAQHSLTGVWTGTLTNDSVTVSKEQGFEIALTQYKEKVYGYSRRTFLVNDTLYYVLKRVKGKVDGDICEINDDEIISYNFPGRLDKGVKVTTTFRMNKEDTSWHLSGEWKTNRSKRYGFYAISGKTELKEQKDLSQSKILDHLDELNLTKEVPFYAATKQSAPAPVVTEPVKEKTVAPRKEAAPVVKVDEKKKQKQETKIQEVVPIPTPSTTPAIVKGPAATVRERITLTPEIVRFTSDSLELSLYDNGEIDGDTVSILLDGVVILANQGLKASAIKTKIYISQDKDSAQLVLFAENLGKYPPNTGLLVVRDGDKVYQIRFSADLKQNASIIFRRRRL